MGTDQESSKCVICGKKMKRAVMAIFKKETCSQKCRTIKWALNEANKVMKNPKKFFALIAVMSLAFSSPGYARDCWVHEMPKERTNIHGCKAKLPVGDNLYMDCLYKDFTMYCPLVAH